MSKGAGVAVAVIGGGLLLFIAQRNSMAALIQDNLDSSPMDSSTSLQNTITNEANNIMETIRTGALDVRQLVNNKNVKAYLKAIRKGEGTADAGGYSRMFGGSMFAGFADHPRIKHTYNGITSSAAGAYQFLSGTWDEMAARYNLADFSPASQDVAAVGLIKRRGALSDVLAGRFMAATVKCSKEWASLPYSPYGQPVQTMTSVYAVLAQNGAQEGAAA